MNSALAILWVLGAMSGLWLLYHLLIRVGRLLVVRFGIETTAVVISSQRCDDKHDAYLQGHYVYQDREGREHTFAFTISVHWSGDEQWRRVTQRYAQGAQNRVRYLPWLPAFHEIELST